VVESGYTVVVGDRGVATFGAVLENTSKDRAAASVTVVARFFDSAGNEVRLLQDYGLSSRPVAIMPGERMGVGAQLLGREVPGDIRTPARMELEVAADTWWPASRVAHVVVSDVRRETKGPDNFFSFAVDAGFALSAGEQRTIIIVRDRAGKVVGGLIPARLRVPWPAGRSMQRVELFRYPIPGGDLARAEVFVGNFELHR
jgi:hypothetical protein